VAKMTKKELQNVIAVLAVTLGNTQKALNIMGQTYSSVTDQLRQLSDELAAYESIVQVAIAESMPKWLKENRMENDEDD